MKSLVGQGKPFHSALDKAAGLLKRKVGTGAEFMNELKGLGGVKQAEIDERKLGEIMGMPKMTHEQFLSALQSRPAPAIREKVLGEQLSPQELAKETNDFIRAQARRYASNNSDNSREYRILAGDEMRRLRGQHLPGIREHVREEVAAQDAPHHEKGYTLPGGENYREMLIKAPKGVEQFSGLPQHFGGEPGILASMRLKDREGPNGEKLLHLEELQSDWHQEGRKKGYHDPEKLAQSEATIQALKAEHKRLGEVKALAQTPEEREAISEQRLAIMGQIRDATIMPSDHVPDAPFKSNWEEMALKRLIHHAAEKGYHGIVVTPGQEQADRYSLSNHVDRLEYFPESGNLIGMKGGNPVVAKTIPQDQLDSYVGKDVAKRLLEQQPQKAKRLGETNMHLLEGQDLNLGGEGMKAFYDKKVPNILNNIGKKYGVKTQLSGMPLHTPKTGQSITDMLRAENMTENDWQDMHPDDRMAMIDRHDQRSKEHQTQLHHFPITEEMRKDVLTNGLPLYAEGGIIHKAEGGRMDTPDLAQMKMGINQRANPALMDNIGLDEALDMNPKTFINPDPQVQTGPRVGGVQAVGGLPIGGVDQSPAPGMQFTPPAPQQGGLPQMGQPPSAGPSSPAQQPPSNILSLTPQGRALGAMAPQGMASGGSAKAKAQARFNMEKLAKGGQPKKGNKPYEEIGNDKRVLFRGEGWGQTQGIVVPRHMWEGNKASGSKKIMGMDEINKARAKVYGEENRDPLHIGQVGRLHKKILAEHFALPLQQQLVAEQNALNRLKEAKHIGKTADTLDKSEKLDTVNHEYDDEGRSYKGFASKGVAGSSLYTSGHGDNRKFHIINTCPGQTKGCGGGHDENGIVDTMRGTCFAPNAESQYAAAAVRRAAHEQAKHDPAMTGDWILAHTGSLRSAANTADKQNRRLLFRPNVVDETDVSSRHVLRHLNEQRKAEGKPIITANSYGKTNELHDPENGYYVTHSNIGPKVKKGQEITENIGKDKQRVRNTIMAEDNSGDFRNEQGNLTPPKGSYMVTDVKRGSPLSRDMEKHITHAKYWTTGRHYSELAKEERDEPEEAHYNGKGEMTTPDKAHYGHVTMNGKRFDYQKQHILHPRLVQVGHNEDGTPHMIPTDSRFKDEDFLPKNRYMTKNGKKAGHILMTTPTESTSTLGAQTSFTHHVNHEHVEHAKKHKGEYEIDSPMAQEQAIGNEYVAPQPVQVLKKTKKYALGGVVVADSDNGLSDDDFHAFPERNFAAQHHLAKRGGAESVTELHPSELHNYEAK